jgi:hypothetical protein
MKFLKIIITGFMTTLFIALPLYADITVLKIEGNAAYKEGNKWVPLKVNQKLAEGVKISTSADSFVDIKLNSKNHTIQVKPFTMVQIFSNETKTDSNTNIALKRGSVNAKVPRDEKIKTQFKITSPIATSSVRGTEQNVSYGPERGMIIEVVSGEVEGRNIHGRINLLTGKQKFIQSISSEKPIHILQDSRDNSIIHVAGLGLTSGEAESMLYMDEQVGAPEGDIIILDNQTKNSNTNVIILFSGP